MAEDNGSRITYDVSSVADACAVLIPPARWIERERRDRTLADSLSSFTESSARARALLLRLCNPEQRAQVRDSSSFTVIGGTSGTPYLIKTYGLPVITVREWKSDLWRQFAHPSGGVDGVGLCIQSTDIRLPIWDIALSAKLMLEGDEAHALETADWYPPSGYSCDWSLDLRTPAIATIPRAETAVGANYHYDLF